MIGAIFVIRDAAGAIVHVRFRETVLLSRTIVIRRIAAIPWSQMKVSNGQKLAVELAVPKWITGRKLRDRIVHRQEDSRFLEKLVVG